MSKNQLNYDEIQDQHLDTMITLAFKHADALEAQELKDECEADECPVDEARVKATYDMFLSKHARQEAEEKKRNRIIQMRRSLPRIVQIAACLVLVLGIAAPLAVANVEAIRIEVMELLIDIQEDHTELQYVENENAEFYVPAEWNGSYYPADIPDGFVPEGINMLGDEATFINENGKYIYYGEYSVDDYIDINSENASLSYTTVNGASTFVIEREDCVILTWNTEDKFFVIIADTTVDEALSMAQSVRRISLAK